MSDNPKKIFDILPPERKINKESGAPPITEIKEAKKSNFGAFKKITLIFLLAAAIFFSVSQFILNKAEIIIWPQTDVLNLSEKISASAGQKTADALTKSINAMVLEENKTMSQDFPATGKSVKTEKARGEIRIFNEYSQSPQSLLANTRLISADGKLFRTIEKITIPGEKQEKGKFQPGFLDVKVVADQPGEEYNIGPSTFSIPGFVGTPKYTAFYGKSSSDMRGGFKGEVPQVTKEDLDSAKNNLSNKILDEFKNSLKDKISADYAFSDNSLSLIITNATSAVDFGKEAKNFNYRVDAKLKTIYFKKDDLKELAQKIIAGVLAADKKLDENSLKIIWEIDSADFDKNAVILSLDIEGRTYSDVKEEQIKEALRGEILADGRQFLLSQPEIKNAKIEFWPFWMNKIPSDTDKIRISLIID